MILYIENPKDSTKTVRLSKFSKVTKYKINIQKLVMFLYTNNLSEKEIKKTIPFAITLKKIKYLGISLTEEVKVLYTKNYKTITREILKVTDKQKNIPCSGNGRTDIVKISILPKVIYRFNGFHNNLSGIFF